MVSDIKSPKLVLNPAFLKQRAEKNEIELFQKEFIILVKRISIKYTERYNNNFMKDFLNSTK
jgi:hypothetical protein